MRQWASKEIRDRLLSSDRMVATSLMKLFERQTEFERVAEYTKDRNGVGFNSVDAPILTSFAKQYQTTLWLSDRQIALARRKLLKYVNQLCQIANTGNA